MSQLSKRKPKEEYEEVEICCFYKSRRIVVFDEPKQITSFVNPNETFLAQLKEIQMLNLIEWVEMTSYKQDQKVLVDNSPYRNLKFFSIPFFMTYEELQTSYNFWIDISKDDFILMNVHEKYDTFDDPSKVIIQSEIIYSENYQGQPQKDSIHVGQYYKLKMEFDKIIVIPFNDTQIIDPYTKDLKLVWKSFLFNLLSSHIYQLDKVWLILPAYVPLLNVLVVVELILQLRIKLHTKNYYQSLVMNVCKIYNQFGNFNNIQITFDIKNQVQKDLVLDSIGERLGAGELKHILELLKADHIIYLLQLNKHLTIQFIKMNDPSLYRTIKSYASSSNSDQLKEIARLTTPALFYGSNDMLSSEEKDLSFQLQLDSSEFKFQNQHKDSEFKQ
ncbi:hypothetical protein pb186bvf_017700 [Paramecium bursaria]